MKIRLCAFADEASEKFSEQLEALNRHRIPFIELRGLDGKNVSELGEKEAISYKKMLDDAGVRVWSVGSPLGKVGLREDFGKHLQLCERVFSLAGIFGTDKIRVFSFYGANPEKDENEVVEKLSAMCELAKKYNVTLYHENEKEIFGDTPERVLKILRRVGGIKSVFDPANYVQCGVDAGKALEMLGAKSDYFHIKDAIAGTGEVVPAGEGDGHLSELVGGLDRDTVFTLEPHLIVFGGYTAIDKTALKGKYTFSSGQEAFAAAVAALAVLLEKNSFREENGAWIK